VSSANIIGSDKEFVVGSQSFIYILLKAKALKFSLGELHISLFLFLVAFDNFISIFLSLR
jgi:hypothetical protein